ncbi:MAG TPA: prenyltransferase/squalene oxidase repeat-containing protein [Planctomycetota bacterium]|nr:prenyltransferase/squalene oxidase repeat-containing protein [Planctomycetota bacterium]
MARLAPRLLRDATELVHRFLGSQLAPGVAFVDRAGKPDLYYSVFGLECLLALQEPPPEPSIAPFVRERASDENAGLVHLGCLARCDAALGGTALSDRDRSRILERVAACRTPDGSWAEEPGRDIGTVYGAFIALGIHQDLGETFPAEGLASFLRGVETPDGAYANERGIPLGSIPATAAAVNVLRHIGVAPRPEAGDWLLSRWNVKSGGFFAIAGAPLPDLLSTATALHTLASLERSIEPIRDACLDFVDSLWTSEGSFYGHWAETTLDTEYTFYGLLALGHLAV